VRTPAYMYFLAVLAIFLLAYSLNIAGSRGAYLEKRVTVLEQDLSMSRVEAANLRFEILCERNPVACELERMGHQ
jgi:hypothetical protein